MTARQILIGIGILFVLSAASDPGAIGGLELLVFFGGIVFVASYLLPRR